jgi:N-acetylneuraminic acid mutarotase
MRKSVALLFVLFFLTASCVMVAKPAFSSTDTAEDTWTTKEPMHVARAGLGVAAVNGKIYAIGGFVQNGGATGTNEEYDPATDTWTLRKPMPAARADFATAVYQNKIYCMDGGVNEVYDPETDTWETKASLPTPRESFATVVFRNRIYVIGGIKGRDPANESLVIYTGVTEVYDPALDKWETKASMPNASSIEACVVINGKIYVISGSKGMPFTAVYDEDTDSWTNKAPMPVAKHGAAVVFDDKIYFIGGSYEDSPSWGLVFVTLLQIYDPSTDTWSEGAQPPNGGVRDESVFMTTGEMAPQRIYVVDESLRIYDPEKDVWTLGPSITINRAFMGVTVLNDKIYAIGGSTTVFLGFDSPPSPGYAVTRYATNEVYTPVGYGTVPPVIDVVSPASQTYNESSVSLVFTVNKQVNWTGYSLDGQETVTITGNTTLSGLTNGLHNITLYAKDTFENTGTSETVSFTVEVPFPATLMVAPVASVVVIGAVLAIYFKKRKR